MPLRTDKWERGDDIVATCTPTARSSRPQRRRRASPVDPMAGGNTSSCSSSPIFHQSPRAAALVSESTSKPASARRRCSSVQVDAGAFTDRQTRPLGRRWGLAACSTLRFQQQACRILQELSAARSHLRSWSRRSSWLGGGSGGPWHAASGSVASVAAGDQECGSIWRCWWCTRAVVGPSGVRLRVSVSHYVPSGRSIDGCE